MHPGGRGAILLLGAAAARSALGLPGGVGAPLPGVPDVAVVVVERAGGPARPVVGEGRVEQWEELWSAAGHEDAVEEVRRRIAAGDVYQVNLVSCWTGRVSGEPGPIVSRTLGLPGATWRGAVTGDGWAVGCASPESLLGVHAGVLTSSPVKGTLAVGEDPARSRTRLAASLKDRAEHIMIVDLVRNDLAQIAATGTVAVPELFVPRRWAGLWHAHSTVSARLRAGAGLADVLRAVLPGGSVTGAPKRAALEVVDALEPVGRGPAMGALGWLDASGDLDLALTIRTVAVDISGAYPRAAIWAGGGITWGSDPRGERAEALAKAAPLLELLSRSGT